MQLLKIGNRWIILSSAASRIWKWGAAAASCFSVRGWLFQRWAICILFNTNVEIFKGHLLPLSKMRGGGSAKKGANRHITPSRCSTVHPTLYNECKYLSMLGLKLIHTSKRDPHSQITNAQIASISYCVIWSLIFVMGAGGTVGNVTDHLCSRSIGFIVWEVNSSNLIKNQISWQLQLCPAASA